MVNWAERKHRKQLGSKGLYALEPNSSIALKSGIKFTIIDSIQQSGDRIFGFQSVEPDGDHKWTSKVLVAGNSKRDDESVVSVIIDAPADKHDPLRPKYAEVPGFVRSILDQMDCDDCGIHLGNKPRQLDAALVSTLIRELEEDDHHGLVLVAGTPDDFPFEAWKKFIADTTKNTVGQSATYVLDVEATNYFNQHVSKYHRVDPGSLRTFVPGADFDDPLDGKRHRFITAQTLADDQLRKAASSIITRRSRAFTNSRPIDRKTRRYNEIFDQKIRGIDSLARSSTKVDGATKKMEPAAVQVKANTAHKLSPKSNNSASVKELTPLQKDLDQVRVQLAEERQKNEELRFEFEYAKLLLEQRAEELNALEDRLRVVVSERAEHELNYAVALEEKDDALTRAEKAEARASYLLSRFPQSELAAEGWGWQSSVEEIKTPSSWTELVEWANSGYLEKCLPWLCFTCDWGRALDLDDQNECAWIATTWDIIRTLNDYGRACQDEKISVTSLYNYLKEPPSGYRSVPLRRYKATESESVTNRKRYRMERTFPVPQEIEGRDENGMIYMDKHFVIAQAGMISPRLYCHDGTGDREYGKVVIGYIGRHLTNDQTN